MTSSYTEKITKLKNAMENVFLKKNEVNDTLSLLLDEMLATEPIKITITDLPQSFRGQYYLRNWQEGSQDYVDQANIQYINGILTFNKPTELTLENMHLVLLPSIGYSVKQMYFYTLTDNQEDIIVSVNDLPSTTDDYYDNN